MKNSHPDSEILDIMNSLIGHERDGTLIEIEEMIVHLNYFNFEVLNGGWTQYFMNSSGEFFDKILKYSIDLKLGGIIQAFEIIKLRYPRLLSKNRDARFEELRNVFADDEFINYINDLIADDTESCAGIAFELTNTHFEQLNNLYDKRSIAK